MGVLLRFLGQTLCVFVVLTVCRGLDVRPEIMLDETFACFSERGLAGKAKTLTEMILQKEIRDLWCRNKDDVRHAVDCCFGVVNQFIRVYLRKVNVEVPDKFLESIITTHATFSKLQDYWCDNYRDYDMDCVLSKLNTITKCRKTKQTDMIRPIVSEFVNSLDTLSIDRVYEFSREVLCRFTRLSYECGAKSIKECPGRTLEVYKELSKMMAPSYCQFFPEKDEEHPTDVSDGLSRKVTEKRSRPSSPEL